jgi:hypothetical protein
MTVVVVQPKSFLTSALGGGGYSKPLLELLPFGRIAVPMVQGTGFVPGAVGTGVTTLMCPFELGNVSLIIASLQDMGGKLLSRSSTSIPGWRSGCLLRHLLLSCKLFK